MALPEPLLVGARTGTQLHGHALFRCGGCSSEWVRPEPWVPAEADGPVNAAVAAEAARR